MLARLDESLPDKALVAIVGYTYASDAWTTKAAAATASQILTSNLSDRLDEFIAGPVLQDLLRPVFSKSNKSVTADGRPAHTRQANPTDRLLTDPPSWKQAGLYVVTVFAWAVRFATVSLAFVLQDASHDHVTHSIVGNSRCQELAFIHSCSDYSI